MICCICKEGEATIHLTHIGGERAQTMDLCEECARKKGITDAVGGLAEELPYGLLPLTGSPPANPSTDHVCY